MSKKKVCTYLIICFCLLFVCIGVIVCELGCTNGIYKIYIKSSCISNNAVGNDWSEKYVMDGKKIGSGVRVVAPLKSDDTKTINTTITEYDVVPDVATEDIIFYLKDGETRKKQIIVTEKNGRYSGNKAVWEIEISVKFIRKTLKKT